jgi:homoserine kinase
MTIHVRAPATTANLGPGFDVAAAALDLWNELEVLDAAGDVDETHLGVRAFARYAPPREWSFRFVDRIPRERGLGSSAAVVALGLVAGAAAAGVEASVEELLAAGLELEGHPANLAAALAGGVCLTWDGHVARIADDMPAAAIAVIPQSRVSTAATRAALPETVPHGDAAFSAGRAALLGAALASGSADLLAAGAADRLHEPYRLEQAPHLAAIRADLPAGALGATLSGSGPTVIVWAEKTRADDVARLLTERFPEHEVARLAVARTGAAAVCNQVAKQPGC